MILIDDLLVRPFVGLLEILHDMAIREAHDVGAIREDIKENQLLYEVGERSEAEYRERQAELEERLAVAREAHQQLRGKAEVIR